MGIVGWRKGIKHPRTALQQKIASRKHKLKTVYGLTLDQFEAMYASQAGQCAICKNYVLKNAICIDHNHSTGKVRALLCRKCNAGLGLFDEHIAVLKIAIEYLSKEF
jgi:hypothetical protein